MRARWVVVSVLGSFVAGGCGLRSDPLFEGDLVADGGLDGGPDLGSEETDTDAPPVSACEMPIQMPLENVVLEGSLGGRGQESGWCGQDNGPEVVYQFVAPYNIDVTMTVLSSDVPLTLRVVEDGCSDGTGRTVMCSNDFLDASKHFYALAGRTYNVTVDTEAGNAGKYAIDVVYGWPALDLCTVHEELIVQQSGGSFVWFNDLGRGQGDVDGACGGPGRENMFRIQTSYPGSMYAEIYGSGGFAPVLSVRTNCAGASELMCTSAEAGGYATTSWYFDAPGSDYYLVADQATIDGGAYELYVYFD
jgi:hypothetical protein